MDGSKLKISPLLCFADDMTVIMEETKENLLKMKAIFQGFKDLSGLEINYGKTKVIRIGANHDDLTPKTDEVKFQYVQTFQLLCVNIDNKLEENFVLRKKNAKLRSTQKSRPISAIWRLRVRGRVKSVVTLRGTHKQT